MRHFAKRLARAAILLCVATLVVPSPVAAQQTARKVSFRMDYIPSGIYSAFYYGKQSGIYQRAGFDVDLLPGVGSTANMDALIRGELDIGFVSCWGMAIGVGAGRDVVSVATFTGRNGFGFFVPKDSGITELKQLAGKKISTAPSSLTTSIYPAALASAGLPADLMQKLSVDPAQTVPTYTRGQADVIATHVPFASPLIEAQRPSNVITWASAGLSLPDFCLAVSRERLNKDKDFIANFLKATFEATVEATKKPEEAAAAAVQLNPLLDKTATLKQWLLMRDYFYTDSTKNCPHGWHSPEDWKKALVTLKQYANLQGDTDNLDKFFTNQFFSCSR